jgi:hypothetical protein
MCQLNLAAGRPCQNGALVRFEKAETEPVLAPEIDVALCVAIAEVSTWDWVHPRLIKKPILADHPAST